MSADDDNDLWMTSQAQGGMSHMNMGGMGMTMPGMALAPAEDAPRCAGAPVAPVEAAPASQPHS